MNKKFRSILFLAIMLISQMGFTQYDTTAVKEDTISFQSSTGLFTRSSAAFTGNVITINQHKIIPGMALTIDQQIQGMIPGLQIVQNSGQPGSNSWLNLRGFNSFLFTDAPQIVLDGIPVPLSTPSERFNFLQEINPADISSITVLKDGASAAIYGSRGGNGVILLSTTRDKKEFYTTIESFYGWQKPFFYDLLNNSQLSALHQQAAVNNETSPDYTGNTFSHNTDWQRELLTTQPLQNYQISMGGGTKLFQFHLSTSYAHQKGIMKKSNFERFTARLNATYNPFKKLKTGINAYTTFSSANLADQGNKNSVIGSMLKAHPGMPVKDDNGNFVLDVSPDGNGLINPVLLNRAMDIEQATDRILGNFFLNYEILPNLKITANTGMNIAETNYRESKNFAASIFSESVLRSTLTEGQSSPDFYMYNMLLQYGLKKQNLSFEITGGYIFESTYDKNKNVRIDNYIFEHNLSGAQSNIFLMTAEAKLKSWIGHADLSWLNKYFIALSARYEASSFYNSKSQWQVFPGLALGWNVKQEPFLQNIKAIKRLKFSASYGRNGIPNNSPNEVPNLFLARTPLGNSSIANPDLEYPLLDQIDVGIAGSFLSGIDFSFSYYSKKTDNPFMLVTAPVTGGFTSFLTNQGAISNYGWELGMGANISGNNLNWYTHLNLARNLNQIGQLGEGTSQVPIYGLPIVMQQGEPIHSFFGYQYEGVNQPDNQQWGETGEPKIADLDQNQRISGSDRIILGNPHPDVFGGWTNNITYGRFNLDVLFHFALGQEIFNSTKATLANFDGINNTTTDALNTWSMSNPQGHLPAAGYRRWPLFQESSWHIEDASFFSLRTLRISYNLPFLSLKKPLVLFANFDNLFTFTNYSGSNPDVISYSQPGIDHFSYPGFSGYALGLRLAL